MSRKIEEKELKEPDKLQIAFYNVMQVLNKNRKKVYMGSAIVILGLILAGGYYFYLLDYEKKANVLYEKVFNEKMKSMTTGNVSTNSIDIYSQVSAKYPSSRAAELAQYRMGNYYYENGDVDKAIKAYNNFLSQSSKENEIKTLALSGLGYCYEAQKDYKKALVSFQKALNTKEGQFFANMMNRNIARIYEQMNDRPKAVEYYKKALTDMTDPSVQLLLKRKIAALS